MGSGARRDFDRAHWRRWDGRWKPVLRCVANDPFRQPGNAEDSARDKNDGTKKRKAEQLLGLVLARPGTSGCDGPEAEGEEKNDERTANDEDGDEDDA